MRKNQMRGVLKMQNLNQMQNDECRMQNEEKRRPTSLSLFCILHFAFCIYLTGCTPAQINPVPVTTTPPPQPPTSLIEANQALASNQPDAAIADAVTYLNSQPFGPDASQAWYVKGRGYEMKVAGDPSGVAENLFQAKSCYLEALHQGPNPSLEGDIHASLSKVDFYQDDFSDAIPEATKGMMQVSSPETKANLLLLIGRSQQRLGEFTDADLTFRQVQQRYPGTPVAAIAHDDEGLKGFYVQLATYTTKDLADQAVASLGNSRAILSERTVANGNTIIDDGPFPTYTDAKSARDHLLKNFPQAVIVP